MQSNSKTPFFSILYSLVITAIALVFLPRMLIKIFRGSLGWKPLYQRLGINVPKEDRGIGGIWFHAVSLGETKAIAPLILQVQKNYPAIPIILTSTTDTGYREAEKLFPQAIRFFLPWDFKWILRPIVKFYLPKMIILSETDLWLHLLQLGKEVGARTVVASAKISERSLSRLKKFPFFSRKLFSYVDKVLVQNPVFEERFLSLGIPPEKIRVTGNLKFDVPYPQFSPEELAETKAKLGLKEGESLITLASTHAPEEGWFIEKLSPLLSAYPQLKIALVPRHPHRFDEVHSLIPAAKRFSAQSESTSQWILVDAMGQLLKIFALSDIAVICGSFNEKIGGHNLLEPCAYKVPTLFGPHVQTQFEMEELALNHKAGLKVTLDDLPETIKNLLDHPDIRHEMGERGAKLMQDLQGIAKKTWNTILIN